MIDTLAGYIDHLTEVVFNLEKQVKELPDAELFKPHGQALLSELDRFMSALSHALLFASQKSIDDQSVRGKRNMSPGQAPREVASHG